MPACSVGSHVRDAAAYVCWAFARAYESDVVAPAVHSLAPALLAVACYDREVSPALCIAALLVFRHHISVSPLRARQSLLQDCLAQDTTVLLRVNVECA